jgi:hypothetical protein
MSPDGRDLRVVEQDARGHWHELDLEIERLDPGAKTAEMWVRIPQLTAGPGQYAWLYYGNPAATLPAETAGTVWDPDFRGVWHLAGSAPPLCDSTRLARHLSASGTPELAVPGAVGPAVRFHTSPDALVTPLLAGEPMTQATLSCWLKAQRQPDGATIVRLPGILLQAWFGDKVNPGVQSSVPYPEGWGGFGWVPEVPVLDDTWHLLALTYDGRCQRYYVDGTPVAQKPFGGDLAGPTAGPTVGGSLKGDLDEVRVSGVAVSGERLRAEFECQRPGSRFVTVTAEEARP